MIEIKGERAIGGTLVAGITYRSDYAMIITAMIVMDPEGVDMNVCTFGEYTLTYKD